MGGLVSRVGDRRGTYKVLVGKSELKRQHGKPKYRWKDMLSRLGWRLTGLISVNTATSYGLLRMRQ